MEKKGKILIVDDSPSNIQIVNNILKIDYDIFFATTGEDAIKNAPKILPDLILLDILMPNMNGYDVIKVLKNEPLTKDIPVIFTTALDNVENEIKGLEAGAVDYITKPVVGAILKARVDTHVELKKQKDFLRNLSTIDGLTGISNRRMLDEYIEKYYRLGIRKKLPLSILMLDIDYFKFYNDFYGHIKGDECLKSIASILKNSLKRGYDLAARYGGEEFCCVLPETELKDAIKVAERIQDSVKESKMEHLASPIVKYVTLSIGIYSSVPTEKTDHNKFIQKADEALYMAKNNGRNRIMFIED